MKTWISILLPNDEYKEKKMLHFLAEGGLLLFLFLIAMTFLNEFFQIDATTILLISILFFTLYVSTRYILSGIEYTDIATEKAYKKELRALTIKTTSFAFIFFVLYLIFVGIPTNSYSWFELIGLILAATLLLFMTSFISLKRSYKKNRELL